MPLSDTYKLVITGCGEAMAQGKAINIDLFQIVQSFSAVRSEIVDLLADVVEDRSNGTRTVREAEYYLFENTIMGAALYLVTCDLMLVPSRDTVISELTPDMMLYTVGPYRNGFTLENRANEESIARSREREEKASRDRAHKAEAKQISDDFLAKLVRALTEWVDVETNLEVKQEVSRLLSGTSLDLEKIALACVLLRRNLDSLVRKSIDI